MNSKELITQPIEMKAILVTLWVKILQRSQKKLLLTHSLDLLSRIKFSSLSGTKSLKHQVLFFMVQKIAER
jgi:hypothetical protein